jgi:hypothetical protein
LRRHRGREKRTSGQVYEKEREKERVREKVREN